MLCYAMLCYAMLCYAMRCDAMRCYAMLCYAMLCYAMLCYAMLCYAMLCYAMLCYGKLFQEFQEFANVEELEILKHCQTRWLSLLRVIERVLHQYPALAATSPAMKTARSRAAWREWWIAWLPQQQSWPYSSWDLFYRFSWTLISCSRYSLPANLTIVMVSVITITAMNGVI